MLYKFVFFLVLTTAFFSCRKPMRPDDPQPLPVPERPVPLRDITIRSLASPYYYFEYGATGSRTFVSVAAGFARYNVVYKGNKIIEMQSIIPGVNEDRIRYFYDNAGRINQVTYAHPRNIVFTKISLKYNGAKLILLERSIMSDGGFAIDKTMRFRYHTDGNVSEIREHRPALNGVAEADFVDRFEQYDNKINVDDFGLLHKDLLDHLILLPDVRLQRNNPGKLTRTGDGINYEILYTYTYSQKNLPLTKTAAGIWLNGSMVGQSFSGNSVYTYYP